MLRHTKKVFLAKAAIVAVAMAVVFILSSAQAADEEEFVSLFDGKTLQGWRVIPPEAKAAWSVQDGLLVGSSDGNGSDLIWKDNELGDFELKLAYRFRTQGNSGIHIRGLLGVSKTHRVSGYHADFGHVGIGPKVLGSWDFHGYPRGDYLVKRGERVVIDEAGKKHFTKLEGAVTADAIHKQDWNTVHVVCRGHRLSFTINGKIASEVIDNEAAKRIDKGLIGLQLHGGAPMTIEFREIRLKRLPAVSNRK